MVPLKGPSPVKCCWAGAPLPPSGKARQRPAPPPPLFVEVIEREYQGPCEPPTPRPCQQFSRTWPQIERHEGESIGRVEHCVVSEGSTKVNANGAFHRSPATPKAALSAAAAILQASRASAVRAASVARASLLSLPMPGAPFRSPQRPQTPVHSRSRPTKLLLPESPTIANSVNRIPTDSVQVLSLAPRHSILSPDMPELPESSSAITTTEKDSKGPLAPSVATYNSLCHDSEVSGGQHVDVETAIIEPKEHGTDSVIRQILEVVYMQPITDQTAVMVVSMCPELKWLARCVILAPQSQRCYNIDDAVGSDDVGNRRRGGSGCGNVRQHVNARTGNALEWTPLFSQFVHIAKLVIHARQFPGSAGHASMWLRAARDDALREALQTQEGWNGPYFHACGEYYHCPATGDTTWTSPAAIPTYIARVAERLLQSHIFSCNNEEDSQTLLEVVAEIHNSKKEERPLRPMNELSATGISKAGTIAGTGTTLSGCVSQDCGTGDVIPETSASDGVVIDPAAFDAASDLQVPDTTSANTGTIGWEVLPSTPSVSTAVPDTPTEERVSPTMLAAISNTKVVCCDGKGQPLPPLAPLPFPPIIANSNPIVAASAVTNIASYFPLKAGVLTQAY